VTHKVVRQDAACNKASRVLALDRMPQPLDTSPSTA
jgi:hypothetical protein